MRVHATYPPFPDFAVVEGGTPTLYGPGQGRPVAANVAVVIEISDSIVAKVGPEKQADHAKGRILFLLGSSTWSTARSRSSPLRGAEGTKRKTFSNRATP